MAIPAAWEDGAAEALALLAPGQGPVTLPGLAEAWIRRLTARAGQTGVLEPLDALALAESLRALLLRRRGAPGAATWRGDAKAEPRFVLNLPAFLDDAGGFDAAGYAEAVRSGVLALEVLTGGRALRLRLGFADLAGLLAASGLPYYSAAARDVATCLSALTRGAAEQASAELAERHGAREPAALLWPRPRPLRRAGGACARRALDAAGATRGLRHVGCYALTLPDAAEALLAPRPAARPRQAPPAWCRTRPARWSSSRPRPPAAPPGCTVPGPPPPCWPRWPRRRGRRWTPPSAPICTRPAHSRSPGRSRPGRCRRRARCSPPVAPSGAWWWAASA
ncbi:hypothetical protein ACFFMP_06960 [Pseudoroseomonas cervicalis]|uniref:hypothetical protein n=1 Tax=Teichococcus cervicalis TaxID=204525 RepID=UPI0035E70DFE